MPTFIQTNISFFIVLLAGLIAATISFVMYRRTVPPVDKKMSVLLGAIRGFYTAAIVIFLFSPELTLIWRENEPKKLSILIDRSASMAIRDGEAKRIDQANAIASRIREEIGEQAEIRTLAFDNDTMTVIQASVDSSNTGTDIARALTLAEKTRPVPDALILISDGNYSVGKNPLHRGANPRIPVYTIGIGDTTEAIDILITDILSQKVVFQNKPTSIEANVMTIGIDSTMLNLELRFRETIVSRKELFINHPNQEYPVSFDITPGIPGRLVYDLKVRPVNGEKNVQNNQALVQIQVLKEKLGIALLTAGADNDFKFFKLLLEDHEDLKVIPVVDIGKIIGSGLQPDSIDVVIWNQIPSEPEKNRIIGGLNVSGYPSLLIVSDRINQQGLTFLNKYLPVSSVSYLGRLVRTQVRLTENGHKFSPVNVHDSRDVNVRFWQTVPPIEYMFGGVTIMPDIKVILETIPLPGQPYEKLPVLMTGSMRGKKNALLLGSGFWRWHFLMTENPQFNATWKRIIYNLMRWLASTGEAKNAQISVLEENPITGSKLHLTTDVYNGSFEPVDNAIVRFQVSGPDGGFEVPANSISAGKYQGDFVPASAGTYTLRSIAWLNDQFLGSDSIRIDVLPVSQEFIQTSQNIELLSRLAEESGGEYFTAEKADSIFTRVNLTPAIVKQTETYQLIDRLSVLFIFIALLSIEWFLRRRRGLA